MKMIKRDNAWSWTTEDELDYIDALYRGTYCRAEGRIPRLSPSARIQNYIGSAKRRVDKCTFNEVDGNAAILYAEHYL